MLSSNYRFHGPNSLRFVYKNGDTAHARIFKVKYVPNSRRETPRFAVVVSKKVHKSAVGRNRIRRRFYEVIRHEIPHMKPGMDIVVLIVSGEALGMPYSDIGAQLRQIFKEANLYK